MATIPDAAQPKIKVGTKTIPIIIKWEQARTLAEKFDYNILKLFGDSEQTDKVMMMLMMDPDFLLNLTYFLCEPYGVSATEVEEAFPSPASLDEVREAFWAAVVNFSNPHLKNLLIEGWAQMKKELKKVTLIEDSTKLQSDSSPEESASQT